MQRDSDTTSTTGRVVLITGAASGIGLACARRLARAGYTVYAGFRPSGRSAPSVQLPGLHWLPLEVTDADSRLEALRAIEVAHGRLDVLVNNAGIHTEGPLEEVPEQTLRAVMEVNFFGAVAMTRTFLPLMRRRSSGVIIMISSLSGLIGVPFDGAYAASKHALEGAAESLRYELEPFGIHVSLLEPGGYATALIGSAGTSRDSPSAYPAFERRRHGARPLERGADPEEAAAVIEATIGAGPPQLRVPCGAQARDVIQRLQSLDDGQRRRFALSVADVAED